MNVSTITIKGRKRSLRGNAAFMNHACDLCANVVSKDNNWKDFMFGKNVSIDDRSEGSQLFISYKDIKEKQEFPCPRSDCPSNHVQRLPQRLVQGGL
jgi:hypothetical protein